MNQWLLPIIGFSIVALVLADVYLTVLYARGGAGIISHRLATLTWRVFRAIARLFRRRRESILAFAGPSLLVLAACTWVCGLILGFALVLWPALGTSIRATSEETPTDFVTAIYVAGGYMTTAGNGDFRPTTGAYRIVTVFDAAVGISVITLMLTYFVQIYTALQRKTTFALAINNATGRTGDAADLLAGLGAGGSFADSRGRISSWADELTFLYESHHFYGSLLFFRFREPFYALPRAVLVVLDAVTLLRTAMAPEKHEFLPQADSVTQLWESGMHLLKQLSRVYLPPEWEPLSGEPPDGSTTASWQRRYDAALRRLKAAGIETVVDEAAGKAAYVTLRRKWDGYVMTFAAYLGHASDEVDAAKLD